MKKISLLCLSLIFSLLTFSQSDSDFETIKELYQNQKYVKIINKYKDKTKKLNGKAIYYIGMAHYMIQKDEDALIYLSKAIEKGPADWDMYYYKGMTLYYLNRLNEAIINVNKAISLLPSELDFYLGKSKIFQAQNEIDSAVYILKKAHSIDSTNNTVSEELAILYSQIGNYAQAALIFRTLLNCIPENTEGHKQALFNLGLSELMSNQADKSELTLKLLIEKYPDDYHALAKLIQALYAQQKYDESNIYKKQLYKSHEKSKLPENMKDMFCFDQFLWQDKLIMAYELFEEIDNGFVTIKYKFFVTDAQGNIEYVIQSESSPAVKMSEGKYILASIKDNNHYSYWDCKFDDDFEYDILKANVIKILSGEVKPAASAIRN